MGDRLKPESLVHLLSEHRISEFDIDCGDQKKDEVRLYEVKVHYVGQFNQLAKALGQKTSRVPLDDGNARYQFPYKGWTFYTINESPMSDSQRLHLA
jgi:hypothetical protein